MKEKLYSALVTLEDNEKWADERLANEGLKIKRKFATIFKSNVAELPGIGYIIDVSNDEDKEALIDICSDMSLI